MSLINREEAISAIQDIEPFVVLDNKSGNVLGSGINCADVVKKLSTLEPAPQWIPCSERLPEDDIEVIVSCTDDSGDTSFSYTTVAWHFKGTWICNNERCFFIIAWMPLPEPYEVENNG